MASQITQWAQETKLKDCTCSLQWTMCSLKQIQRGNSTAFICYFIIIIALKGLNCRIESKGLRVLKEMRTSRVT